jgi:hypothetical protein
MAEAYENQQRGGLILISRRSSLVGTPKVFFFVSSNGLHY